MSVEQVGPGGVSNSYGVRTTTSKVVYENDNSYQDVFIPTGSVPVTATPSDAGLVFQAGDASIQPAAATQYALPPAVVRITASQGVVGKSCGLKSVKCIAGSAIALSIYDNPTAASGQVIFAQTMSAGDEVRIPTITQAVDGLYASFTGTATFDIGVQDVA